MSTLIGIILLGIYGIGAWKFWAGFSRTDFSSSKMYLTLMWPVLLIGNKSYRRNFNKAIKGS
ncbi:MAG: hypothetical protein HC800_00900 [Phormidesmis sp. RL_2_1]|nr:hypothetical protein [Phormidesmis sp. RL_2_1]